MLIFPLTSCYTGVIIKNVETEGNMKLFQKIMKKCLNYLVGGSIYGNEKAF